MTTNPYFRNFGHERTQRLVSDLIIESIKMFGYDIYYIPRTVENMDLVFGEDTLSKFEHYNVIEAYIKNVDGFAGQGRFMSKFGGLEFRDQITFTIAKRRFDQIRTEKVMTENGWNLQLENANTKVPFSHSSIMLEEGNVDSFSITFERPREGDLIYFPMADKIFEIKYVNYETVFYQLGQLQVYDLECELFEYSNERFETGYQPIDNIEDLFNTNLKNFEIVMEDGEPIEKEDGDSLVQEVMLPEAADKSANNNVFTTESDGVVDFGERSPFVKHNEHFKW